MTISEKGVAPVRSRSIRSRSNEGFIVVAVLWILAALATLASVYAIYVSNTVSAARVNDDRIQAQALVSAALELTAYQLTAADEETRPSRGTFGFRMGGAGVAVEGPPEAPPPPLNTPPKRPVGGLFFPLPPPPPPAPLLPP